MYGYYDNNAYFWHPNNIELMNFDLTLLGIGKIQLNSGYNFSRVCSSFSRLFWVTEGKGAVVLEGKPHSLEAGNLYLIPPLVTHDVCNEGANKHYYIFFTDCSMQIYDHFQKYTYPFGIKATETDEAIIRYMMTIAPEFSIPDYNPQSYDNPQVTLQRIKDFQKLPVARRMEINGLLHILLSHFMAEATPHSSVNDQRIRGAMWNINHDLAAVPSLDTLAEKACMAKNSFIRLFRTQIGFTPTDYIIRRRIMRAQLLFISGNSSVKDVANQVGYDNISYFGRTFKRIVGICPREFLRQNKM